MGQMTLRCDAKCGRTVFIWSPNRGLNATFSTIAIKAYGLGWKNMNGRWFCGEGCVATMAKDITPDTSLLPSFLTTGD